MAAHIEPEKNHLFLCPDAKETREGIMSQERSSEFSLPENAVGAGLSQRDGGQSQALPCLATCSLEVASSTEPYVDPSGGKLSPMPTSSNKEEAMQFVDLCNSNEKRQEITGGQHSDSSFQLHRLKEIGTNLWSTINDKLQGLKAIITGKFLERKSHQERKQDRGTLKSSGNKRKSNDGQSKEQGEGKLKNCQRAPATAYKRKAITSGSPPLAKRSRISVTTGHNSQASHLFSSASAIDPQLSKVKEKRKGTLNEEEPSHKKTKITTGHGSSALEKLQHKAQCNEKARINLGLSGKQSTKRYQKAEAEQAAKPVPRSNLALELKGVEKVLYLLSKSNVSSMPSKKVHSDASYNPLPEYLTAKLFPRPLVNPPSQSLSKPPLQCLPNSSLHPQHKPPSYPMTKVSSHLSKPSPYGLPKQHPWQKLPLLPVPTQQPKPLWKQVPSAAVPPIPKSLAAQFLPSRGWRPQAGAAGKTTSLVTHRADLAPKLWQSRNLQVVTTSSLPEDPSSSPPYEGATFIPWRTPPPHLESSEPITDEQRPLREMMKREAQKQREEAACWTSVGRIKFFVEREKEMDISVHFGYPKFGCPWR